MLYPTNNSGLDILQSIHLHEKKTSRRAAERGKWGPHTPAWRQFSVNSILVTLLLHHDTHDHFLGK